MAQIRTSFCVISGLKMQKSMKWVLPKSTWPKVLSRRFAIPPYCILPLLAPLVSFINSLLSNKAIRLLQNRGIMIKRLFQSSVQYLLFFRELKLCTELY